jgi:hypothetical protein
MANLGGNKRLHEYAVALKEFAAKEKIPYTDQFHALVDIWGTNKRNEIRLGNILSVKAIASNDKLPGVEHLRAFLAANEKDMDQLVSMQGDAVHPGPTGQLMMAAALLKELGAESFVSSAEINARDLSAKTRGCKVTGVGVGDNGLNFDRFDDCLPFPIPDDARSALRLYPTILDMSQYTLKVIGLKSGHYDLRVNNVLIATLPSKELEAGVNLTTFGSDPASKLANPIAAQGKAVLAAVSARAGLVGQWRGQSKAAHADKAPVDLMAKLNALTKAVADADERIREAAQPKKLHFELSPR